MRESQSAVLASSCAHVFLNASCFFLGILEEEVYIRAGYVASLSRFDLWTPPARQTTWCLRRGPNSSTWSRPLSSTRAPAAITHGREVVRSQHATLSGMSFTTPDPRDFFEHPGHAVNEGRLLFQTHVSYWILHKRFLDGWGKSEWNLRCGSAESSWPPFHPLQTLNRAFFGNSGSKW